MSNTGATSTATTTATPQTANDWATKLLLTIVALSVTGLLTWVVRTTLTNTTDIITLKAAYGEQQKLAKLQGDQFAKQMLSVATKLDNAAKNLEDVSKGMYPREEAERQAKEILNKLEPVYFDYMYREKQGRTQARTN